MTKGQSSIERVQKPKEVLEHVLITNLEYFTKRFAHNEQRYSLIQQLRNMTSTDHLVDPVGLPGTGGKSYQSIKVEYPDNEDASIDALTSQSIISAHAKRLRTMLLVCAAVLATAAYSGRVRVFQAAGMDYTTTGTNAVASSPMAEASIVPDESFEEDLTIAISAPFQSSTSKTSEPQCFNPDGIAVGPSGNQDFTPTNTFVGTTFERKNGDNCPCSFVSELILIVMQ